MSRLKRALKLFLFVRLRDAFAVIGLLAVIAGGYFYAKGEGALQRLDPKASQVLGDFLLKALETDVASATSIKMPLAEGVSIEEAIESMKLRANQRNIKLISRIPFHKEIKAITGKDYPYLEIFEFCDPLTAAKLLQYNPDFVVHMPCRIALYRDTLGRAFVATMNLEVLIHGSRELDATLKSEVVGIKDGLLDIMAAGATGDL